MSTVERHAETPSWQRDDTPGAGTRWIADGTQAQVTPSTNDKEPPAGWVPSTERGRRQKTRIIEQALDLFSQHGYAGVGMTKIAEAAAVSTGTLYRYFPSKELLFISVLDRVLYDMYNAARGGRGKGILESITQSTYQYLLAFSRNRMVIGSASELMGASPHVQKMWWSMRSQLHEGMLVRLREHQRLSPTEPLEPTILIAVLTSMVDGFGHRAFVEREFGELDDAALRSSAQVLAGVWYRSIFGDREPKSPQPSGSASDAG